MKRDTPRIIHYGFLVITSFEGLEKHTDSYSKIPVNRLQINRTEHSFRFFVKIILSQTQMTRQGFSSNFGKRPLAKIGKNDRLSIKIGRN